LATMTAPMMLFIMPALSILGIRDDFIGMGR
jgi:hypothetical protein